MHVLQFAIPKGAIALPLDEMPDGHSHSSAPYIDRRIPGWWKQLPEGISSQIRDEKTGDHVSTANYS